MPPYLCGLFLLLQSHTSLSFFASLSCLILEAMWAMSHRFTYRPNPTLIILGCVATLLLPIPTTVLISLRDLASGYRYTGTACVWEGGDISWVIYTAYTMVLNWAYLGIAITCSAILVVSNLGICAIISLIMVDKIP
eukprot:sb/3474524/